MTFNAYGNHAGNRPMYRKRKQCMLIWLLKVCVVGVICDLVQQGIMYNLASTKIVNVSV